MLLYVPPADGWKGWARRLLTAVTVLWQLRETWRAGERPHLTIVAGSSWARLFISTLWCHWPLLPVSFPCHAVVCLGNPKNKRREGSLVVNETIATVFSWKKRKTQQKTFHVLTFKNYNWEIETWTEKSSCNSKRFQGLKTIYVIEMKSFLN